MERRVAMVGWVAMTEGKEQWSSPNWSGLDPHGTTKTRSPTFMPRMISVLGR